MGTDAEARGGEPFEEGKRSLQGQGGCLCSPGSRISAGCPAWASPPSKVDSLNVTSKCDMCKPSQGHGDKKELAGDRCPDVVLVITMAHYTDEKTEAQRN